MEICKGVQQLGDCLKMGLREVSISGALNEVGFGSPGCSHRVKWSLCHTINHFIIKSQEANAHCNRCIWCNSLVYALSRHADGHKWAGAALNFQRLSFAIVKWSLWAPHVQIMDLCSRISTPYQMVIICVTRRWKYQIRKTIHYNSVDQMTIYPSCCDYCDQH